MCSGSLVPRLLVGGEPGYEASAVDKGGSFSGLVVYSQDNVCL